MAGGSKSSPSKPYAAPPSVGHEIGVMFGFLGFMALCMLVYGVLWNIANKRSQQREKERVERLKSSGLLRDEKRESVVRDSNGL